MKTIVCFGDSNTHGYDAVSGGRFAKDVRWPGQLQQQLGSEFDVKEEGLSGRTCVFTDPLFGSLNGYDFIEGVLLTHEPVDTLIIMLGTNDTKTRFSCNAVNIAKGLERLVSRAMSVRDAWANQTPDILIIAPPPIEDGYQDSDVAGEMGPGCAEKSRQLAPLYADVANRLGCRFLDAGSIDGMCMNTIDYMHLTPESHALLARAVSEILL